MAVAEIARRIDPSAEVSTAGWIERLDGARELNVRIRNTTSDGQPQSTIVVCYDRKASVQQTDIEELTQQYDAPSLARTLVCCSCGYTPGALLKAASLGIHALAPHIRRDGVVQIDCVLLHIAERVTPTLESVSFSHPPIASLGSFQQEAAFVALDGLSIGGWVSALARRLFRAHPDARRIRFDCGLAPTERWTIDGHPFRPSALQIIVGFQRTTVCRQEAKLLEGLPTEFFSQPPHPPVQVRSLSPADSAGWHELDPECLQDNAVPNSLKIRDQLLREALDSDSAPDVDSLIRESAIAIEPVSN